VGKYLKANFPTLKDNVIRDLVHEHVATCTEGYRFISTSEEMVHAVQNGPHSCMAWSGTRAHRHPYMCYAPAFGWSMAIRELDEEIVSRALVYKGRAGRMFVRAYGQGSHDDELRCWLMAQGVEYVDSWPEGAKLALVNGTDGNTLFPYLDGDTQRVNIESDCLRISEHGDHECTNQDGTADSDDDDDDAHYCEDCDERIDDDENYYWVNRRQDRLVCNCCLDGDYTYVNDSYYVADNNAIEISGEMYDENNLPDPYVTLPNGCNVFEHEAWLCCATDDWYLESEVTPVWFEGDSYHPDHAPQEADPEDEFAKSYDKPEGSISNEVQTVMPWPFASPAKDEDEDEDEDEDDPYAELRAASAAGAVIEILNARGEWNVIHDPHFNASVDEYRICRMEEAR
jgi:hypothetical protein